jgi:uncharacterized membrane protein
MNSLVIMLRIVHILSGVFWVGSAFFLAFFLTPALAANPDSAPRYMAFLITKSRLTTRIAAAAGLTILAGGSLYWIDSQGLTSAWTNSGPGVGFGLGALFALIGFVFGMLVGVHSTRIGKTASQIQGKPTDEQMKIIQGAQKRLALVSPISNIALVLALLCMATARYWRF